MAGGIQPMKGRVCLITGATSGIGAVTACALAERGATVIVAGRSPERSADTARWVQEQTGTPSVSFLVGDLSSQREIRQLAQQFQKRHQRLDVLINNAGALYSRRQLTVDGIEMTFAVNYLAPFLLTNLLLDQLRASAPSRIINVSSEAHRWARLDFDDLQSERGYFGFRVYGQAKLALLMFTYELARRLAGTGVTVNALHPGFVATGFALNNPGITRLLWRLLTLLAISPERGAETSIYLAASPEVEGVTGSYYKKRRPIHSSAASYDLDASHRLWDLSLKMTGLPASEQQAA